MGSGKVKKIIIFGVCGNIGLYLLDYFIANKSKNYEVIGVDIDSCDFARKNVEFIQMNINDKDEFSKLPSEDIYAVIDLVGPMPARMEGYHPEEYVRTNVLGTFHVVQYCIENHVERFLYARSFCDILRRAEKELTLTTKMAPSFDYGDQHSVYAVSQMAADEFIKCMHAYYGLKTFVFRLPTVYLWSRNDMYCVRGKPVKMMYRHMIDCAIQGKPVEVWGDPSRKKDMLYVKDLCQMLFKACFINRDEGFYNAGTGIGTTLLDQVKGMIQVFDESGNSCPVFCPEKPNAPQYIMDINEAVNELGYKPEFSYIEMLTDMKKERELDRF